LSLTSSVVPFKYQTLPLGSIKPLGWLRNQLELSASGLAGHEWDFYRFVNNSTWTGGTWEYSGLHETAPYWFNYIVPLAYTLDDARLKKQAKEFLDHVLATQQADGWLGTETKSEERGLWGRFFVLMGMIVSCPNFP
jgi:carbohydrate-binding DOMON domain-containing protein